MDKDELAKAYVQYAPRLLRAAVRLMGALDAAEDAVQWTFAKALTSSFEGRSSAGTWLHEIMFHRCLEMRRNERRWARLVVSSEVLECSAQGMESALVLTRVRESLPKLSKSERVALLGMLEGRVVSRCDVHRARRRLRALLDVD